MSEKSKSVKHEFHKDVHRCTRCGQSHWGVLFTPLNNNKVYSYSGICPNTKQPILMKTVNDGD